MLALQNRVHSIADLSNVTLPYETKMTVAPAKCINTVWSPLSNKMHKFVCENHEITNENAKKNVSISTKNIYLENA